MDSGCLPKSKASHTHVQCIKISIVLHAAVNACFGICIASHKVVKNKCS